MSRIAYVNGRYVPHDKAHVHIEDRGYQFSDGVYEVAAVCRARVIDEEPHLDRLERSLQALRMDLPIPRPALRLVTCEVLRRNQVRDGMVYLQVTRGVAARDHPFPDAAEGALVLTARPVAWPRMAAGDRGVDVVSLPDQRWGRCDVKSVSLLPNVLGKQSARERGPSRLGSSTRKATSRKARRRTPGWSTRAAGSSRAASNRTSSAASRARP